MGLGEFWLQFNNGKKEQLNDTKHGVRKEQVDKKFHNLFDAYDANNDGTLEENEVQTIFGHLKNFAGDNVLDSAENLKAKSVFADQVNMQDVDFQGFVKSVSDATSNIISSEETKTSDGGKEIKTEYQDGTTETIAYYSNGDFKWKKVEKKYEKTSYELIIDGKIKELKEEEFQKALNKLDEKSKTQAQTKIGIEGQKIIFPLQTQNAEVKKSTKQWKEHTQEYSPRFVAEKLGVDINTDEGKKILERMSYLPKEGLDQIKDGAELKDVLSSNDLPPNFDNISNVLELMYGVTLRNEEEYEASKPQREKIVQQIQTVGIMSELYARVAEFNDNYTDSQGLFGMGSEGIGYILNKIGIQGENHYQWADSCREFIEKINEFKVLNPAKFEQEFKESTGKENFNVDALQKMVELSKNNKALDEEGNYTEEFKQAVKDFSNFDVSNPNAKAWYHPDNLISGLGEALIMIGTLGWGAETKAGQMLATSTMATFSRLGVAAASKQVNNKLLQGALRLSGQGIKLIGPALNEGTKMYAYTAAVGTATNVANRAIKFDSEENTLDKFLDTEAMVLDSATGSFGFGAFAGVFGSTVTQKVMQRASRVSQKVGTALSDKFAAGAVDANEVFTTILEKSAPTKIAEAAAFATDVLGFTAFESVLAIVKNLDNYPDGYSVEDLTNIIWEELKSQGYNLCQIKIVAWLMSSRSARMQATRYMKDAMPQLRGATVEGVNGGKDGYKINLPDGRKIECKNTTEYISALHLMVRGETAFSNKFDIKNKNIETLSSDKIDIRNTDIEKFFEPKKLNKKESDVLRKEISKRMPFSTVLSEINGNALQYLDYITKKYPNLLESDNLWDFHNKRLVEMLKEGNLEVLKSSAKAIDCIIRDPETIKKLKDNKINIFEIPYSNIFELLPMVTNLPTEEYYDTDQTHTVLKIAEHIKTPEQYDAILKIIQKQKEASKTSFLNYSAKEYSDIVRDYIINETIEKFLDSPEKVDDYVKFYMSLKKESDFSLKFLIERPEELQAYWDIVTSKKYNLSSGDTRVLSDLAVNLGDFTRKYYVIHIKSLLDKKIDFESAYWAERYIGDINDPNFTADILNSKDAYELYSHMFDSKWFDKFDKYDHIKLHYQNMRDYCTEGGTQLLNREKLQTCIGIQKLYHKDFSCIKKEQFSPIFKIMLEDRILSDDIIWHFTNFCNERCINFDEASYQKAKEYYAASDSKSENTLWMYMNIVAEGLDKESIEKALNDAKEKKNQIKSGREDITNADIEKFFAQNTRKIDEVIKLIGISAFEYAFTSKIEGMERLCKAAEEITYKQNNDKNIYRIHSRIVRISDDDYTLTDTKIITKIKQALQDKSIEPQEKIKKLKTLAALKTHCTIEEFEGFIDLIKPNKPTQEQVKKAVDIWSNNKMFYEDKWNAFCEEFGIEKDNTKVKEFFEKRATINAKGFKILNGVKVADMQQFLSSIVRNNNQKIWNEAINKKVFALAGTEYSEKVSEKLDLTSSPDLDLILAGTSEFYYTFKMMIERLSKYPEMSVKEVFDNLPQNIETKRQYAERGIDYEKITTPDKNSYKAVKIEVNAEKTRQDCITNLVNEFNDVAFKNLPKEETQKILNALKEELGIEAKIILTPDCDGDGFLVGQKEVLQFFNKDGSSIVFNNLSKMMSVIKKAMNTNDFWSETNPNPEIERNKSTFYDHIMKSRDEEISTAENIKSDKVTEVSIQQVDMNEMPYGLMLGAKLCCTSPTGCNAFSAPTYVMNKCIGAFDIKEGKNPVGNTMMYFAEIEGQLSLVLDNIEVKSGFKDDVVRDAFMEYVSEWCKEKGLSDIPIYAGPNRHKFTMDVFPIEKHDVTIIGSTGSDRVYIDYAHDRIIDGEKPIDKVDLFAVRPSKK